MTKKCEAKSGAYQQHKCPHNGKIQRGSLWLCGTHDPEGRMVKRQAGPFLDPIADLTPLERCPFCLRTPALVTNVESGEYRGDTITGWRVRCAYDKCHVRPFTRNTSSPKIAVSRWNKRDGKSAWTDKEKP